MRYVDLIESEQPDLLNGLLYRATLENVTEDYIRRDAMIARTVHFIPEMKRTVRGLSTSFDPKLWGKRYRFIWVLDGSKIANPKWAINGQAALELTGHRRHKAMRPPAFNMRGTADYLHAYQVSPPDEVFIKGDLAPISQYCVKLMYRKTGGWEELEARFLAYGEQHQIPVEQADW